MSSYDALIVVVNEMWQAVAKMPKGTKAFLVLHHLPGTSSAGFHVKAVFGAPDGKMHTHQSEIIHLREIPEFLTMEVMLESVSDSIRKNEKGLTFHENKAQSQESVQENYGPVPPTHSPDTSPDKGDPS